jgi:hypothetical protein
MARKEKQYHFIYKTTNLLNGKYYYGMHSTDNLNDGYYGSGRRLKCSLNKYGKKNHNFEIIEHLPTRKALINREKEIINLNEIAKESCMNLMIGGVGGYISEEQQRNRSHCGGVAYSIKLKTDNEFKKMIHDIRSEKAKTNYKLGIYKDKRYDNFKNMNHTNETKKIMSEAHRGNGIGDKNSQHNTCWITNGIINKKIKKTNINSIINTEWKLGRIIKPACYENT